MILVQKRAAGVFPDCQATESALNQLKSSGFHIDKVSVVVRHVGQDDQSVRSQDEFVRQKNLE